MPAPTYLHNFNSTAFQTAVSYGGLTSNPDPLQLSHNDGYDAYRHALMSAYLSEWLGQEWAKKLMDDYEQNHPNPADEENMDKWNNNVGREEYTKWREATDSGRTVDPLEKWIYDAVKSNKTINTPSDTSGQKGSETFAI